MTDNTKGAQAGQRDALLQVALDFIGTLTGMSPPPIESAPPEVFAPFYAFVDRVQSITAAPQAERQSLDKDYWPCDPSMSRRQLVHRIGQMNFRLTALREENAGLINQNGRLRKAQATPMQQPAGEHPAPFGYVNTQTGQFFTDVESSRKNNEGHWRTVYVDADRAARAAPTQVDTPKGFALVPTRPTRAMDDVMDAEGWQWEDLLAAAAGVEYLEADAPTQVDAGAETGARAALFDAQHAIQDLLSWDAQRGFPLTYKVRDPLHVVLRSCLDALAAQGGQEAEPVAKIVMNRYGGKKTEWFDAQEAAEMPVGTLIYARPPRTQGYVPTRGYSLSAIDAETVARALERVARLDAGNGMYAKPGNQPEWKIARKLWTFLKHGQQGDAQADADKLDFMERQRVLVAPEYEGQWEALVYGDQEKPSIKGTGNTPRAAIADAIARQNGKDGAA